MFSDHRYARYEHFVHKFTSGISVEPNACYLSI